MRLEAEARMTEEPRVGKLHAGICVGAVGQPAVLQRHASSWRRMLRFEVVTSEVSS